MLKRKKKARCQSPNYNRHTFPPHPGLGHQPTKKITGSPPMHTTNFEEYCQPKQIKKFSVGTEDRVGILLSTHPDMLKIENAEIYWSEQACMVAVCTTKEWKDYFLGKINIPKENTK